MKKNYHYIDHTADLGIEVYGKTPTQLFINIAKAIFETQVAGKLQIKKEIKIDLEAESIEELFIDWCRELLYNFSVHGFIPKKYKVTVKKNHLQAVLSGDKFDRNRHRIMIEIKNPTYHNFNIKKSKNGFQATIIFDV